MNELTTYTHTCDPVQYSVCAAVLAYLWSTTSRLRIAKPVLWNPQDRRRARCPPSGLRYPHIYIIYMRKRDPDRGQILGRCVAFLSITVRIMFVQMYACMHACMCASTSRRVCVVLCWTIATHTSFDSSDREPRQYPKQSEAHRSVLTIARRASNASGLVIWSSSRNRIGPLYSLGMSVSQIRLISHHPATFMISVQRPPPLESIHRRSMNDASRVRVVFNSV